MSDDAGIKVQLVRIQHHLATVRGGLAEFIDRGELFPTVTPLELEQAERDLGFALPPLLQAVYLYVGNGGEVLNLMGLPGGQRGWDVFDEETCDGIVEAYRLAIADQPKSKRKRWPARRVPIYDDHGCGMISCVDCTTPAGAVWLRDSGTWHKMNETLFEYFAQVLTLPADA